jgi:hypothetical protein
MAKNFLVRQDPLTLLYSFLVRDGNFIVVDPEHPEECECCAPCCAWTDGIPPSTLTATISGYDNSCCGSEAVGPVTVDLISDPGSLADWSGTWDSDSICGEGTPSAQQGYRFKVRVTCDVDPETGLYGFYVTAGTIEGSSPRTSPISCHPLMIVATVQNALDTCGNLIADFTVTITE